MSVWGRVVVSQNLQLFLPVFPRHLDQAKRLPIPLSTASRGRVLPALAGRSHWRVLYRAPCSAPGVWPGEGSHGPRNRTVPGIDYI